MQLYNLNGWTGFSLNKRYFIELCYNGNQYHGWQSQDNAGTIQATLENSLLKITGEKIGIVGAGRTDTGVHAKFFAAHLDGKGDLFDNRMLFLYKMNCVLPSDIAITNIRPVTAEAHARYSALSRTYEYVISKRKNPFLRDFSWFFAKPLDVDILNQASAVLKNYTDFTSFSKLHSNVKTNTCHIVQAIWEETEDQIVFRIEADRFLRNMVRAVVGTLISVGTGKINIQDFVRIIEGKDRGMALASAPAQGLSMIAVKYPEEIYL